MPQSVTYLPSALFVKVYRDAQKRRTSIGAILRELAEEKYGGAKP